MVTFASLLAPFETDPWIHKSYLEALYERRTI
jgi:hypothetical protein